MADLSGHSVNTIDNALTVFSDRNLSSTFGLLDKGVSIQLGTVSVVDDREWVEVGLVNGSSRFALASAVRSHTDVPREVRDIRKELNVPPHSSQTRDEPKRSAWSFFVGWGLIVFAILGTLTQWGQPLTPTLLTAAVMIMLGVGSLKSRTFAIVVGILFITILAVAFISTYMHKR
jgi:small-conductance mechanosensitive channel